MQLKAQDVFFPKNHVLEKRQNPTPWNDLEDKKLLCGILYYGNGN